MMLRRFREEHTLSDNEKVTYAGRLDPMAEGIVPVLVGEARFQKERFLKKSKTYEVEILLGVGTDTGDMLGLISSGTAIINEIRPFSMDQLASAIKTLSETVSLPYPNYSSRPVDGKPLFMHARAGNEVVLPIKKVSIYDLEVLSVKDKIIGDLVAEAIEVIKMVQGDFRQKDIIERWESLARSDLAGESLQIVTIRTTVSSGTYMRAIAEKLGLLLKVPALAYSIKRIKIEGLK